MKKILTPVLALLVAMSLGACSNVNHNASIEQHASRGGEKGKSAAEDVILEIVNDGNATKITDAAYNRYFHGNAAQNVSALLNAGKVYVNGIKVPANENDMVEYQVNGVPSLYKTQSGWGFNVHKTTSANNLSFEAARLGFFETITTVRGHKTVLLGDRATGRINKIDAQSYDVVRVTDITVYNESITVTRGDFALETRRVRPDVDLIVFHSSKFDRKIAIGDVAVYYYGAEGWVIEKAVGIEGTLAKGEGSHVFVINKGQRNEYEHIESNVSRYNLMNSNRPTQFFTAYVRLGLSKLPVITWCTATGHPIGFTYGDKAAAKNALTQAIENANAAKKGVVVSVDGTDVPRGTMWVAQADLDAFNAAIAKAQAIRNRNSTAVQQYDMAIFDLADALGEAGNKPTGFLGAQGEGSRN